MGYIFERHNLLEQEMKVRGFKIREENKIIPLLEMVNEPYLENSYYPFIEDTYINLERILLRIYTMIYINNKPNYYKYKGINYTFMDWCILYTEKLKLDEKRVHKIISNIEEKCNERF